MTEATPKLYPLVGEWPLTESSMASRKAQLALFRVVNNNRDWVLMMKAVIKNQRWKIFWVVFSKRADVTPVFKADAKDVVKNYRSISLLSIPSKCQERIVYNAVYPHVAPYLTDWQHGFVRGRSCATQLASLTINDHLEWGQTGGRCFPGLCKGI